ncbi:apolipoprotein N-acyltransferase [Marinifilum caeruleilacunae]|uniref:Apolipoprotein N-acyltransferase n=1 Tax=Marinifilum caeruleilacunae TaxID=2499076 RepID=A0ABX1WZB7_9BACT|nr:apolipoprotein N-acyltransferase [Marinifilum caeruleilacunae]
MNKNLLLALSSGILLGIPFCIPSLFFLILFAWIPLLFLESKLSKHHNPYLIYNYSFLAFSLWNIMAYWWVAQAHFLGAILIILINSLLLALIFWFISKARKTLRISILFPFLIIWLGFEYFHTIWDLAWPWLNLGNSFASAPSWIQWYEFTGTRGGSLWIILINYSIFEIIRREKSFKYSQIVILLILFGIPLLYSSILNDIKPAKLDGNKSFALIQPNLDPYTEKFAPENEEKHFDEFIRIADSICRKDAPDFLFGPETLILQSIDENHPSASQHYQKLMDLKNQYPKTKFLIGVHSKIENESFNSALLLSDSVPQFYHKTKLVPMFERIPFDKYLGFLDKYSLEIGGYNGTYSSRNETNYFIEKGTAIIPIVCFESIFGDYCAQRIPETKGFICMITNDGWWKNTAGYLHHFNFSRLRAIESRREYVRVANNGISALIDSKGTIIAKTSWWNKTILSGNVSLLSGTTFYTEHGDFIGRICLFFAILLLIFVKIRTYTHRISGRKY